MLDLETTGLNPEVDRIIQIAVTLHYVDKEPISWCSLIDPEIPIMNTGKHQVTELDMRSCTKCKRIREHHEDEDHEFARVPMFRDIAHKLAPRILHVDVCGYNVSFDLGFLKAEMKRAEAHWPWDGHIIDPLHIYKIKRGHTLSNAYIEYVDAKGFENAHDAGADVRATELVLAGQLDRHPDLPRNVKELSSFCFPHPEGAIDQKGRFIWVGDEPAINFGKFRGKLLKDVDKFYLHWIMKNDFPPEIKTLVDSALKGIFIKKEDWK